MWGVCNNRKYCVLNFLTLIYQKRFKGLFNRCSAPRYSWYQYNKADSVKYWGMHTLWYRSKLRKRFLAKWIFRKLLYLVVHSSRILLHVTAHVHIFVKLCLTLLTCQLGAAASSPCLRSQCRLLLSWQSLRQLWAQLAVPDREYRKLWS